MATGVHKVAIRVGGQLLENWTEYSITLDMLQPADGFTMAIGPVDPVGGEFGQVYDVVKPDAPVQIFIDDVLVMTGYIDDRVGSSSRAGDTIAINGRDKGGRLTDESMPMVAFKGLGIEDLALKIAAPWFESVTLSHATNRRLIAGGSKGAKPGRVSAEPAIDKGAKGHRKVEPGETRWSVLEYFLREAGLLAWSTADGKSLFVGKPNYAQEPSFFFFHPKAGSPRAAGANVLALEVRDSVGERYSRVVAVGANAGNALDYADRVTKRRGVVSNGPGEYGIGADFQHRKVLLLADDAIKDDRQAFVRATREMAERDATGHELTIQTFGLGQAVNGATFPTLFGPDKVAHVESEVFGISGRYYITQAKLAKSRGGEFTDLRLVPLNTELRS